jgi:TrmH family RNA methyltransferase
MIASKNTLKLIQRLKLPKFRYSDNLYVVEGDKMVNEAIKYVPNCIKFIVTTQHSSVLKNTPIQNSIYSISVDELTRISSQKNPQHSIAVIEFERLENKNFNNDELILCCDDIQDPGNFGTIIRTADWFGIKTIVASKNTVDVYNQKVIQASMGSIFRVHVEYVELVEWLQTCNRYKIGTVLQGTSLYDMIAPENSLLIVGNEGKGISQEIQFLLDEKIKIPGYGKAESLNAAVATGIVLAELTKKYHHA